MTADPRAVRAGLQGHGGTGKLREQPGECGPGVGQRSLTDNLAGSIQHTDVMLTVSEVQAEGEPADDSGSGG